MVKKEFNATHLAFKQALSEVIAGRPVPLTAVLYSLENSDTDLPTIPVRAEYEGLPACKVIEIIRLKARRYGELMELSYNAGLNNEEYL